MRLRVLRNAAWAVWLGVAALGLNALVPIHAAFDLADGLDLPGASRVPSPAAPRGLEWHVLALVAGHDEPGDKPDGDKANTAGDRHHHADCAVCSALGALVGFAWAAAVLLPVPHAIEASPLISIAAEEPGLAPAAAYRSRAPPAG